MLQLWKGGGDQAIGLPDRCASRFQTGIGRMTKVIALMMPLAAGFLVILLLITWSIRHSRLANY